MVGPQVRSHRGTASANRNFDWVARTVMRTITLRNCMVAILSFAVMNIVMLQQYQKAPPPMNNYKSISSPSSQLLAGNEKKDTQLLPPVQKWNRIKHHEADQGLMKNTSKTSIEVVIAHYKEWESKEVPKWARNDYLKSMSTQDVQYFTQPLYQRTDPQKPRFVPNNGFESGVYVKYIIDNYYNLPDVIVFTQADACHINMEGALLKLRKELVHQAGGYLPLNSEVVRNRGFETWGGRSYTRRMEDCFRQVASDFGRDDVFENIPYYEHSSDSHSRGFHINMVCCACFSVSSERIIKAAPLAVWQRFYDRAIARGECIEGRVDIDHGKYETGGAFEHLVHVIVGGKEAMWEPVSLEHLLASNRHIVSDMNNIAVTGIFDFNGTSSAAGDEVCKTIGASQFVCPWNKYCPRGRLHEGINPSDSQEEMWAPLAESHGQSVWVSVGSKNTCHQRGVLDELSMAKIRKVMCCADAKTKTTIERKYDKGRAIGTPNSHTHTKNSSLRFDWTNLPPMTPLGQIMERSSSLCLNESFVKENGPIELVMFNMIPSGMGSSLHTWMNPLCHASSTGKILLTGNMDKFGKNWLWNDELKCSKEFEKQIAFMGTEVQAYRSYSALGCYFGWHESGLRCPPESVAWNKPRVYHNDIWQRYECNDYHQTHGRSGVLSAVAEWLFQNVSVLVIQEAERQIREEAFPTTSVSTLGDQAQQWNAEGFQRWKELPDSSSLITVHIRWGDKKREMQLVTMEEIINGTKLLLSDEELAGSKNVHIYIATEDPHAVEKFRLAASRNWIIHASGPKNPTGDEVRMMDAAYESKGRAGLQSLGALLISLEANRYVLATQSNWSRLINELRKSIVDSRCGNCTRIVDLRYGEL